MIVALDRADDHRLGRRAVRRGDKMLLEYRHDLHESVARDHEIWKEYFEILKLLPEDAHLLGEAVHDLLCRRAFGEHVVYKSDRRVSVTINHILANLCY
ncbi:hypothetical protein SDC9_137277 [bioreactor metagenome]|uniref:Uncharacterized protein n=1 Tax=bioreactor metagenome TaxID=1076179 RepID=A0A645DL37_9ZZZZ